MCGSDRCPAGWLILTGRDSKRVTVASRPSSKGYVIISSIEDHTGIGIDDGRPEIAKAVRVGGIQVSTQTEETTLPEDSKAYLNVFFRLFLPWAVCISWATWLNPWLTEEAQSWLTF